MKRRRKRCKEERWREEERDEEKRIVEGEKERKEI